jgi:hypothetical protein
MNRPLLIVAACATLVCVVCFAAARSLGDFSMPWGPQFERGPAVDGGGPRISRTIPWSGATEFEVSIPAEVVFVQGPESKLEISGPSGAVNAIELDDNTLRFRRRVRDADDIVVRLTAPNVQRFEINGAAELRLEKYDRDQLEVRVNGAADVVGSGRAREVEVHIAGAGDVDLGGVQAETAEVHIAGGGDVTVSPTRKIEVHIAGAGDVNVTTRPPEVESHVAGAGGIEFTAPVPEAAPSPAPEPPKAPTKSAI